ncbi:uncharacterized protein [Lepisosteus oculatus]|uniref:uncharacterized protein n=1 Tax=Lepisosteus oculatus TaxID=7918 RepID=UPI003718C37E
MQSWVLLCLCLWGGWDWCASGVTAQSTTTRAPSTTTTALSTTTTAKSTATLSTTTTALSTTTTAKSTATLSTTTTAKSTAAPNTTTTAKSTAAPNTTTTAKSTAAPNTTTTAKSTTTPNTTTTAKSTAAPNTTTTAKSTAAPNTTTTAKSTAAPNTTTTAKSTAALSTTTEMTTTPAPNCTTQWTVTTTTIVGVTQGGFTNATATGNGKNWTEPLQNRTFTFTDLSPGCTYNITLHQGASDHCFSTSTTVASMVSNLTLDSAVTDSLSVSWTGAPGCVTGYTVSVNQTSRVSQLLPNETQLSIGDLTPGTVYEVRVVTMGQGERSAPAPLLASTALDCDAQNWTVGESSLQVEVPQGSFQRASAVRGNSSALNASSTGSTATFSGLEPGCTYAVALWSRLDTRLCETERSLSAEPVSDVSVRSLSTTALAASWPGARGCVKQYRVSVSGPDLQIFTKTTTGTALDIPDLQPGCNYTVGVTTEGEGRDSTEVTSTAATDPDSVGSPSCQPLSGGYSLRLSWTAPRGVWTGLEVRVSGRPPLQEVGHQDWVDITGLQPARDYDIAVTTLSGTRRSTAE